MPRTCPSSSQPSFGGTKKPVTIGTAGRKPHPTARRLNRYKLTIDNWLHAEMEACLQAKPGDKLEILRWHADGKLSMAHPCPHCLERIRKAGIISVRYTDWEGKWQEFNPQDLSEDDLQWWHSQYYAQRPRVQGWPRNTGSCGELAETSSLLS